MPESPLAKKLKLKPGLRAAVVNAPKDYLDELKHNSDISQKLTGKFDWIQVFAEDKNELASFAPKAVSALKPNSILWLSFPKAAPGSKLTSPATKVGSPYRIWI